MSPLRKEKFQSKSTRSEFLTAVNLLLMRIKNFNNKEDFGRKGLFGVDSLIKITNPLEAHKNWIINNS
jgi:hypothetical protein